MTFIDILLIVAAYLFGSIPTALLLFRYAGLGDIREYGSGNIGATNMARVGSKKLGAITLLIDGGKGVVAVLLAHLFASSPNIVLAATLVAVLGHIFPVWLRFHGGKGVATSLGALLALHWPIGGAVCITWLIVYFYTRISAMSAVLAMFISPVFGFMWGNTATGALCITLAFIVIYRHKSNIKRIIEGTEE